MAITGGRMKKIIYICDICDKQTDEVADFETIIPYIDEDECFIKQHLKYELCKICYNKLAKDLFNVIESFGLKIRK